MLNVRASVSKCYFDMLDKLQKQVCSTFGPTLAFFYAPFSNHENVEALLNWMNMFVVDCLIFQLPFLDSIEMSLSTVSFLAELDL